MPALAVGICRSWRGSVPLAACFSSLVTLAKARRREPTLLRFCLTTKLGRSEFSQFLCVLIEHVDTLLGVLGRDADELPRRSDSSECLSVLKCELHVRLSNLENLYLVGRTRCGHGRKIQTFI